MAKAPLVFREKKNGPASTEPFSEIKDCALDMKQCTHGTRASSNDAPAWPKCPWCARDLAVLDRDPATHVIRYTCLAARCVCYRQAMCPDAGEVAS